MIFYIEATIADSIDGKGTPPPAMIDAVWDGSTDPATGVVEFDPDVVKPLNERGRRPLGLFDIDMQPVTIREIDIIITDYQSLTPEKETSILNAMEAALADIRPFIDSVDVLATKNDIFSVFIASFIVQQAEPGSIFTAINIEIVIWSLIFEQ